MPQFHKKSCKKWQITSLRPQPVESASSMFQKSFLETFNELAGNPLRSNSYGHYHAIYSRESNGYFFFFGEDEFLNRTVSKIENVRYLQKNNREKRKQHKKRIKNRIGKRTEKKKKKYSEKKMVRKIAIKSEQDLQKNSDVFDDWDKNHQNINEMFNEMKQIKESLNLLKEQNEQLREMVRHFEYVYDPSQQHHHSHAIEWKTNNNNNYSQDENNDDIYHLEEIEGDPFTQQQRDDLPILSPLIETNSSLLPSDQDAHSDSEGFIYPQPVMGVEPFQTLVQDGEI